MTRQRFAALALIALVTLPVASLVFDRRDRAWHFEEGERRSSYTEEDEHDNRQILLDENGVIAQDAHFNAIMQRQTLLAGSPGVADAGVTRTSWTSLGPDFSGRIRTIVVHPTRTNHMLVGAATGGVFKSTDAGVTWTPVDDFLPAMAIRTFAMNPMNPEQVYAGTGEVVQGVGLLRSEDFGETWQQLAGSQNMGAVYRIRISPNGSTLYAATESGIYRVTNNGTTFERIHGGAADDIEFDPSNQLRLIASAWLDGKKVIMRLGASGWTTSTGAPTAPGYYDFIELAYAPSNSQIVYALTSENQGRFYRSNDGGASFQFVSNTASVSGASWASALWVNPFDSNSIVAGGVSLGKSTDGGSSWASAWWPGACTPRDVCVWGPVDHHEVVAHPAFDNTTNRSLYLVADQGVFLLPNLGEDRLEARIGGLVTLQSYGVAVDQGSGMILTGTQDMGSHLLIEGQRVSIGVGPGDGGFVAIDPRDPNVFYFTVRSSTDRLGLIRYSGGPGSTPTGLMRCNEPAYRLPDACDSLGNPESPVVMDLRAPDRLYAGGLRLWRTDNATEAVSPTSGPRWTNLALPSERAGNFVSAVAIAPNDSDVVWAARNAGEIYMTTNATAAAPTWVRVGESQLPTRRPTRVVMAPQDPRMVYVTFGGYAANVWRTFNSGAHWENSTGVGATGLPLVPVRDLEIHPAANGAHWLYVATEIGLFASENGGQSWFVPTSGPASVRIDELAWHNQNLVLATHGRGLWKAAVGNPTPMTIPGPPINFSASLSSGTLSAAWDASPIGAAPQQYLIQASTANDFSNLLAELPTGLTRTFSFAGVPPGVFYLRVVAKNSAGSSAPSNVQVIGAPATQPPVAPSNLVANVNGNMLTLTWSAPAAGGAPTTYFIDAGTAPGSSNIASLPTGNAQTSFAVTAPNGLYFVRVRAGNAVGISAASNEVSFRIGPAPCTIPPTNPANLQALVSGGVVTLTWTPPTGPGLTGYRLEAGSAAGLSNLAVIDIGPTTAFSVSAPRGTYFVRMISLSACGPSNPSPDVTVVVP